VNYESYFKPWMDAERRDALASGATPNNPIWFIETVRVADLPDLPTDFKSMKAVGKINLTYAIENRANASRRLRLADSVDANCYGSSFVWVDAKSLWVMPASDRRPEYLRRVACIKDQVEKILMMT
jgi:hypothetical protein